MSGHVARDVALIVNPSAGGGRAAKALPAVEARLLALGLGVEVDATRDLGHARELAVGAAQRGRVVVTLSGDGMLGAVAGALRAVPGAVVGVLPGGRGNDFARVAGIPLDAEAACDVIAGGTARAIDLAWPATTPTSGSRRWGSTPRPTGSPTRRRRSSASSCTSTAPCARWRPGSRRSSPSRSTASGSRFSGWGIAMANSKAYGGGMFVAPDAELDDGALDVVRLERTSKARFLRSCCRRCSRASTSTSPACTCCAAPRCTSTPTGRSSSTPTATRSASCR